VKINPNVGKINPYAVPGSADTLQPGGITMGTIALTFLDTPKTLNWQKQPWQDQLAGVGDPLPR
jgi:hypothetical protein